MGRLHIGYWLEWGHFWTLEHNWEYQRKIRNAGLDLSSTASVILTPDSSPVTMTTRGTWSIVQGHSRTNFRQKLYLPTRDTCNSRSYWFWLHRRNKYVAATHKNSTDSCRAESCSTVVAFMCGWSVSTNTGQRRGKLWFKSSSVLSGRSKEKQAF